MATIIVPTFEDPFYSYTLTLDGTAYLFDFRYNQREETWFFSVALEDGTPLISGVKVVVGVDLLRRAGEVRLPRGLLTAVATESEDKSPPGLLELGEGKRVTLTYITPDELGR